MRLFTAHTIQGEHISMQLITESNGWKHPGPQVFAETLKVDGLLTSRMFGINDKPR